MKFRRRLVSALAALALIVGGVIGSASPALATVYGCPDSGYICFYNYESFNAAGGIYVQDSGPRNVCHTLPTSGIAGWTNGKVYNAASSILYNWTGTNVVQRTVYMYDNNNCTSTNFVHIIYPGELRTDDYRLANTGWNDRVGSWKVV